MIEGACLCGGLTYEVDGSPLLMYHCYCAMCRAASGASFATNVVYPTASLRILTGEELLAHFGSSPGKRRHFCRSCGSPIYSQSQARPDIISVRSGTLRSDPGVRPSCHVFVASRAHWVEIGDDGLPRHEGALA